MAGRARQAAPRRPTGGSSIPRRGRRSVENITIAGGPAPARAYIEERPRDGYGAQNDREAIKVMIEG
jgi:hypothetical protein